MIYFDNAATTLTKPPEVTAAVVQAMNTFGGVGRGVHEASVAAGMAVYEAREKVAALLGAPGADRVAFTMNATEAINIAVAGVLGSGGHAITTAASHNSVLRPLYREESRGCGLSILPVSPDGSIDYRQLEGLFRPNTRLAIVTHGSNLTGDVYDIARIARTCRENGVLCAVDIAQTAGHIPFDMQGLGVDIALFTGHKSLFGPQGTGGLCLGKGVELPAFLVGGSGSHSYDREHPQAMPEHLEAGTLNSHGIAGLAAGIGYIERTGIGEIGRSVEVLVRRFEAGVRGIDGIALYGRADGSAGCGIVALNVADVDSALISDMLATQFGICTRAGAHCAPLMHKALGTDGQGIVRFSFSPFNTEEEIDRGIEALAAIVEDLGSQSRRTF